MLEKTEWARMDSPETQSTLGTQDTEWRHKKNKNKNKNQKKPHKKLKRWATWIPTIKLGWTQMLVKY